MKKYILITLSILCIINLSLSTSVLPYNLTKTKFNKNYQTPRAMLYHPTLSNRISFLPVSFKSLLSPTDEDMPAFNPENLTESDNAFHVSNESYATEWWYFDATLNQRYTLQFSIHIYTILSIGFATTQCSIYDSGTTLISNRTVHPLSTVQLSTEKPFININNDISMKTLSQSGEQMCTYQIEYSDNNISFNLTFQGLTQGWKGTTEAGNWAVALPKAITSGTLTIQNTTHSVAGIGYHDHNWNVTVSTGLNYGWLWGKTITNQHALTWATIFKTWYNQAPLLVINTDDSGYVNIPIDHIDFSITNIEFRNGMIIPFGFQIVAQYEEYALSLTIKIIDSDFITVLGLINYWRYHTHTTGTLRIDNQSETINNYNIAEFIRFRPY